MRILPRAICKEFTVEKEQTTLNERGSQIKAWTPSGSFEGVITESSSYNRYGRDSRNLEKQPQHPYTHKVVHEGLPMAQVGDRLVFNGRYFYVVNTENPAEMGLVTLYKCEERTGV